MSRYHFLTLIYWKIRVSAPGGMVGKLSYQLRKEYEPDGTIVFYGSGNSRDYGAFGCIITSLKEKSWFMDYVIKWIWYNSDDGENEKDFAIEDVLYHYTKRVSVA